MTSTPARVADLIAQNRLRKALILANTLLAHNFSCEEARQLDDHGWHIVAVSAGTSPPSRQTRQIVIRIVRGSTRSDKSGRRQTSLSKF